jgi:hypothetical protein
MPDAVGRGMASIHTQQQESAFHLTVCSSCVLAIKRAIGSLLVFLDARTSLLSEKQESIEVAPLTQCMRSECINTSMPLRPPNICAGAITRTFRAYPRLACKFGVPSADLPKQIWVHGLAIFYAERDDVATGCNTRQGDQETHGNPRHLAHAMRQQTGDTKR